jgi:uncharacterized YigZ family protein
MLFEDVYLTIKEPSEGLFKDKGSKFSGFAFPVSSEDDVKKHLSDLKKQHPSANHHCYAFRLGADKQSYRVNDDGEPANTAGKPIFGQIQSKDLTDILIVVVRYFGGTLLGVSGLINAYKLAAGDTLQNATIIEKTVNDVYEITFDYLKMNDVMRILKEDNLKILSHSSELNCSLSFSVRKNNSTNVYDKLSKIRGTEIKYIRTV